MILCFLATAQSETKIREKGESGLVRSVIKRLHTRFRSAIVQSDYLIACINKDDNWFNKHKQSKKQAKMFCDYHLDPLKKTLKDRYSKMRLLMGLAQYTSFSDSFRVLTEEAAVNMKLPEFDPSRPAFHYSVKQDIKHPFQDGAKLKPLTLYEMHQAELIRIKDLRIRAKIRNGNATKEERKSAYCADESMKPYISLTNKCYELAYYQLIAGDNAKRIKSFPMLAYLDSDLFNFYNVTKALEAIKANAEKFLAELEDKYFIVYADGSAYLRENLDYTIHENFDLFYFNEVLNKVVEQSRDINGDKDQLWVFLKDRINLERKNKLKNQMWLQLGGMIAWGVSCGLIFRRIITAGLCELPIGLFANVYFYVHDSDEFNKAIESAFYSPDGALPLGKWPNQLTDLAFAKNLSLFMLPLFTGVPKIIKGIKQL